MYSDNMKQPSQDVLQTNGKEKHDSTIEPKIPHVIHGRSVDEDGNSKRRPKRYFVTTKRRREYFETKSRKH
jgi:hypothetical protein